MMELNWLYHITLAKLLKYQCKTIFVTLFASVPTVSVLQVQYNHNY